MILPTIFSLFVFVGGWGLLYASLKGHVFDFDFGGNKASFPIIQVPLRGTFYVIFTASMLEAVGDALLKLEAVALVMMFAAFYALLFNGLIVVFYEAYLHQKYSWDPETVGRSNYTANRYAIILSLGWAAAILFFLGTALSILTVLGH